MIGGVTPHMPGAAVAPSRYGPKGHRPYEHALRPPRRRSHRRRYRYLVAAYEGLSAPVRAFVDTLRAEHRYGGSRPVDGDSEYARRINDNLLVAVHPVVRVHPETGERALFVNPGFTSHIVDVTPSESKRILDLLYAEITRPEYTCASAGSPDMLPSGTTAPPPTSPRATWTT